MNRHDTRVLGHIALLILGVVGHGVARALQQVREHRGNRIDRVFVHNARDLVDDGVEHGVLLAEYRGTAKVTKLGGVLVGRALFYEQAKVANEVRVGKADRLLALGRGAHAGDDEVDLAVVERIDKAREALLDGNGLATEGLADNLGDLHVVAIGIGALHVVDGDGVLAGFGDLPVVRGVGRLHADADLVLADHGIGQVVATAARRGLNHLERGGALTAGERAGDDGSARSESTTQKDATAAYRLWMRVALMGRMHNLPSLLNRMLTTQQDTARRYPLVCIHTSLRTGK